MMSMEELPHEANDNKEQVMKSTESLEISDDAVAEALGANPELHLNDCPQYNQWIEQEQAKVTSARESFFLMLRGAEMLKRAGRIETARHTLMDAREEALYSKDIEGTMIGDIDRRLKELG